MEPHAAIAVWDGDKLTLYSVDPDRRQRSERHGAGVWLKPENVRIISPHVGGGFGSKGGAWPMSLSAAMAAKIVNRPVKLGLTRQNMFNSVGLRQRDRQRLRIAATDDGKLVPLGHDTTTHTAPTNEFAEPCGSLAGMMYDVANSRIGYRVGVMNIIPGPTNALRRVDRKFRSRVRNGRDGTRVENGSDRVFGSKISQTSIRQMANRSHRGRPSRH